MTKQEVIDQLDAAIDGLDKVHTNNNIDSQKIGFAIGILTAVRWHLPEDV